MQTVLILIGLAALAYVLAHLVVERLQARFLIASGSEYLLLGLLIGPHMVWGSALSVETLESLHPIMALVIGGVGLFFGLQANFRSLLLRDDGALQVAATMFLAAALGVGVGTFFLLQTPLAGGFSAREATAAAWVLAASASVTSAGAMEIIQRRFKASGPLTELIEGTMRAGQLLGIIAFGIVFCVFHQADPLHVGWDYANWLMVSVVVGAGLAFLFRAFIGNATDDSDHIFLAIIGIIVFASGAAYYLQLSPMLVNLVLGMTLANISRSADIILDTMQRLQPPVFILLLVLGGALWEPIPVNGLVVVAAYVLLRFAVRLLGGWLASTSSEIAPRDIGRGMLSQGDVAVAMVVSYKIVFDGPIVDIVFTAVLASVVFSELTSARQLRALLIDSGDIQRDDQGAGGSTGSSGAGSSGAGSSAADPPARTEIQGA